MAKTRKKTGSKRAPRKIIGVSAMSGFLNMPPPKLTAVRAELESVGINPEELTSWLAPELAMYRWHERDRANHMQRSEEVAFLRDLIARVDYLAHYLRPDAMPWLTHVSLLNFEQENWEQLRARIERDFWTLRPLLTHVARKLDSATTKRGRKDTRERDALLARLIERVQAAGGLKKTPARLLALKVLRACEIAGPSPDQMAPEKAAARAARSR